MKSRPLLHVGMPKCASTWLQMHLFKPRHGFRQALFPFATYLDFISPSSFYCSHPGSKVELDKPDGLVPVISSEVLIGSPLTGGAEGETNLYRLHNAFPDARILIVIREQNAMLRSLYKLLVNFGLPYKIETVLFNDLVGNVPTFDLKYLCYDYKIEAYQQAFGKDSVLVLPYEQFKLKPKQFLDAIRLFCEIEPDHYPIQANMDKRENTNRSLVSLEIKRLYNRYIAKTKFSMEGLYKPTQISGRANFNPLVPLVVERWLEKRFAAKVVRMTDGFYAESNARTETLANLSLGEYGYQLP